MESKNLKASKERFEWHSYYTKRVIDTNTNKIIGILDTLNQQDQRIAELEEQLKNLKEKYVSIINENVIAFNKLEKELENAIVPKFKIGQEVWFVRYFNAGCYEFDYGKVIQIKITEYDGIFYEMEYLNKCEIDFRSRHEKYVFATKEEAQAKLEALKGDHK